MPWNLQQGSSVLFDVQNRLLPAQWCLYEKSAARATGLQKPPQWVSQSLKAWVLNAELHLDEDGVPVPLNESPYIWLGDVCVGRPDILWQAEVSTGQHLIANPSTKSIAELIYFLNSAYRLISRAFLINFKEVSPRNINEQDALDVLLDKAMDHAHGAAGEIISLGKIMSS